MRAACRPPKLRAEASPIRPSHPRRRGAVGSCHRADAHPRPAARRQVRLGAQCKLQGRLGAVCFPPLLPPLQEQQAAVLVLLKQPAAPCRPAHPAAADSPAVAVCCF